MYRRPRSVSALRLHGTCASNRSAFYTCTARARTSKDGASESEPARAKAETKRGAMSQYIAGFLAGQIVAYCERVRTGMSLACEISFPRQHADTLIHLVEREGCRSTVDPDNDERVTLWIYRNDMARVLIEQLQSTCPTELSMWSTGKLFGYSDREVVNFIQRSKSAGAMSASPVESSLHPCSGTLSSDRE